MADFFCGAAKITQRRKQMMKFVVRVMRSVILKTVYTYLSEMKSLISLLSVTIIAVQFASAQSVPKRLSLNESLELALANNNQIKKKQAGSPGPGAKGQGGPKRSVA